MTDDFSKKLRNLLDGRRDLRSVSTVEHCYTFRGQGVNPADLGDHNDVRGRGAGAWTRSSQQGQQGACSERDRRRLIT